MSWTHSKTALDRMYPALAQQQLSPQAKKEVPFGYLATYDVYEATGPLMFNTVESKKLLEQLLVDMVHELKMVQASPSIVYMSTPEEAKTKEHVGASGYVTLEDSGIMVHTIVNTNPKFACFDVFSCAQFEPRQIEGFLAKHFQTTHIVTKFITRGTDYETLQQEYAQR
jgi:S-adenosylmethionine/arginine decarboxylase-like enzyme